MPWYEKSMKDVTTCDKLRIGGNNQIPADLRMGQPGTGNAVPSVSESIGYRRQPRELKHLSTWWKRKQK